MGDLISRQAAINLLSLGKEILSRVLDDMDVVGADREKYSWGLGLIESNIEDIEELPAVQPERWIPCSERPPEPDEEVFVYLWDNVPYIASMNGEGQWETEDFYLDVEDAPKAWIPLPKPYKEEQND